MSAQEISDLLSQFEKLMGKSPSESKSIDQHQTIPESKSDSNPEKRNFLDDGSYQTPIRSGWKNLGGFTTSPYMVGKVQKKNHLGLDMSAPVGTPIFSIGEGKVTQIMSEANNALGGNSVVIRHPSGLSSYYAHMNSVDVKVGQHVTKETQIGTVGNSGNAKHTAPHLHIEVSNGGSKIDPLSIFGKKASERTKEITKQANEFLFSVIDFIDQF